MMRSIVYMAGATLARLVSGAVLMVFIARCLGPQEFGHFVLALSVAMVMALLVEFGHSTFVMRELGRKHEPAAVLLAHALRAKGLLAIVFVAVALLVWASGAVAAVAPLGFICLCLMALLVTLADFLNVCFRGVQRFEVETRNVVFGSVVHVLLVAPVAWHYRAWVEIAAAFLLSRFIYLLASIFSFRLVFRGVGAALRDAGGVSAAMRQIRQTLVYAADASLVTVRSYADVFLISTFLGAGPLGLYQAGMNLVRAVENLGPIIANVFLPKLSGLLEQPREFGRHERQLLLLLLGCGLTSFGVLLLTPDSLLTAVFGESFAPMFRLLPLFGLYLLARFVAMALGVVLTARGFQSGRALAGLVSLVVLFVFSWALMPFWGVMAVAAANVVAALLLVAWFALRLRSGSMCFRDGLSLSVLTGTLLLMAYFVIGDSA
jgi:O-antigen/teichoic acid export membrane protein